MRLVVSKIWAQRDACCQGSIPKRAFLCGARSLVDVPSLTLCIPADGLDESVAGGVEMRSESRVVLIDVALLEMAEDARLWITRMVVTTNPSSSLTRKLVITA